MYLKVFKTFVNINILFHFLKFLTMRNVIHFVCLLLTFGFTLAYPGKGDANHLGTPPTLPAANHGTFSPNEGTPRSKGKAQKYLSGSRQDIKDEIFQKSIFGVTDATANYQKEIRVPKGPPSNKANTPR
jgi:hypothetical protein